MQTPTHRTSSQANPKTRPNYRIDRYLKGWKVFVDTCSLMTEGSEAFFQDAIPRFQKANQKFLCPVRCIEEINRHLHSEKDGRRKKAKRAKSIIGQLQTAKVLDLRVEETDNFPDYVFQCQFVRHRIKHSLLLITQDRGLATDLMAMNNSHAVSSANPIHVLQIQNDGSLNVLRHKTENHWMTLPVVKRSSNPRPHAINTNRQTATQHKSVQHQQAPRKSQQPKPNPITSKTTGRSPMPVCANDSFDLPWGSEGPSFTVYSQNQVVSTREERPNKSDRQTDFVANVACRAKPNSPKQAKSPSKKATKNVPQKEKRQAFRFSMPSTVTTLEDRKNVVGKIPVAGDVVIDGAGQTYKLVKELGSGGEGIVYDTGTDLVAKIYRAEKNTTLKKEKIRRLTAHPLSCTGLCAPVKMLFTVNNEFVGYLMPRAQGHELLRCLLVRPLLEKRFAGWHKSDLVQLCITILEKIRYLHSKNVILGDINLSNIKVVSPTEVYLVDCDSYQIEDLPCPVGQVNFTAPEIQGVNFPSTLRTKGNEYFAVATMLFMILVPGKTPYAHQGGSNGANNIREGLFPYPYEDRGTGMVPPGVWGFVWSHMTYEIKKSFGHTFDMRGDYYAEESRLSVDDWLQRLRHYLKLLNNGMLLRQDEMSNDIFPTRLKKNAESTMHTCKLCGQEFDEKSGREGICNSCLKYRGVIYPCKACGTDIVFSNFDRYILKKPLKPLCASCFEKKRREQQAAIERKKAIAYTTNCINCGATIQMTQGECDFYTQKGLTFPKRCKDCRDNPQRIYSQTRSTQNSASNGDGFILGLIKGIFGIK